MTLKKDPALAALMGNPSKTPARVRDAAAAAVSVPVLSSIPAPYGVLSPTAGRLFETLAGALIDAGLLTRLDVPLLSAYCVSYAAFLSAQAEYQAAPTVEGQKGNTVKNPAAQVARDNLTLAHALGKDLGLSPSARKSLSGSPAVEPNVSPLELVLSGPIAM